MYNTIDGNDNVVLRQTQLKHFKTKKLNLKKLYITYNFFM